MTNLDNIYVILPLFNESKVLNEVIDEVQGTFKNIIVIIKIEETINKSKILNHSGWGIINTFIIVAKTTNPPIINIGYIVFFSINRDTPRPIAKPRP